MSLSLLMVAGALALPLAASAQDAMGTHMMAAPKDSGTMICRKANAGEKASAMMTDGKTAIVCKAVSAEMMHKGPDAAELSKAVTVQQVNEVWAKWIASMSSVPATGGG